MQVCLLLGVMHNPMFFKTNNSLLHCVKTDWRVNLYGWSNINNTNSVVMFLFIQVGAHYFEEGNVQLDAKHECKDSTLFQVVTKTNMFSINFLFYFLIRLPILFLTNPQSFFCFPFCYSSITALLCNFIQLWSSSFLHCLENFDTVD